MKQTFQYTLVMLIGIISVLTQRDVYLDNCLYGVISSPSLLECAAECSVHSVCLSFGFEPASLSCHLNIHDSNSARNELTTKAGWYHGDITLWPKFSGACSVLDCSSKERCWIPPITKIPVCVKANPVLPFGYCPLPSPVPNANISYGQQREGSVRKYTCNHGYLDTSLDTSVATTKCMSNGKWSAMSLNCTGPYIRLEAPWFRINTHTIIAPETFRLITGNTSTIVFLSRGCRDTNFAIFTRFNKYRIIIGGWGNTRSSIQKCSPCQHKADHEENNIVSCNEFRCFWISWKMGIISVGRGSVAGGQKFLEWKSPVPFTVIKVGISAYIKNTGTWLFSPQM